MIAIIWLLSNKSLDRIQRFSCLVRWQGYTVFIVYWAFAKRVQMINTNKYCKQLAWSNSRKIVKFYRIERNFFLTTTMRNCTLWTSHKKYKNVKMLFELRASILSCILSWYCHLTIICFIFCKFSCKTVWQEKI